MPRKPFKDSFVNRLLLLTALVPGLRAAPAMAQPVRFTDTSNRWLFLECSFNDVTGSNRTNVTALRWAGDTMLNGRRYQRMNNGTAVFFREDTLAGKIFVRTAHGATDTAEQLYFDYGLRAGDTLTKQLSNGSISRMRVARLDSVLLGSVVHRRWELQLVAPSTSLIPAYTFLEGVGCLGGVQVPLATLWQGGQLRCFTNRQGQPACTPVPLPGCSAPVPIRTGIAPVTTFDNSTSCILTPVGVADPEPDGTVALVPNPGGPAMQLRLPGVYRYVVEDRCRGSRYGGRLVFQ